MRNSNISFPRRQCDGNDVPNQTILQSVIESDPITDVSNRAHRSEVFYCRIHTWSDEDSTRGQLPKKIEIAFRSKWPRPVHQCRVLWSSAVRCGVLRELSWSLARGLSIVTLCICASCVCQSVSLSVCQSVSQSVSRSVCRSVGQSVCLSVGQSVCLCVSLCVSLHVGVCVGKSITNRDLMCCVCVSVRVSDCVCVACARCVWRKCGVCVVAWCGWGGGCVCEVWCGLLWRGVVRVSVCLCVCSNEHRNLIRIKGENTCMMPMFSSPATWNAHCPRMFTTLAMRCSPTSAKVAPFCWPLLLAHVGPCSGA